MSEEKQTPEEKIHGIAKGMLKSSVGYLSDEVNSDRAKALKYFKGDVRGDEIKGRSQVVTSEVSDTILAMMPPLMKIFTQPGRSVRYEALKEEAEDGAKQSTDYVNNVVFGIDNDIFKIAYNWFFDALCQKNGIVKWYWDETDTEELKEFSNLTIEELIQLTESDDVEVVEHTENEDFTHDVKLKVTSKTGKVRVVNVPPDEFLISARARDIESANLVAHRVRMRVSEGVQMGFDREAMEGLTDSLSEITEEDWVRFDDQESVSFSDEHADKSEREFWCNECYLKVDLDDTGIGRLVKCWIGGEDGSVILGWEEATEKPFAAICPIPIPHVFYGMSQADLTMPLQDIATATLRGVLDSMYLANNPRMLAVEGQVDLDDLLTPRAGGIVRAKRSDAVRELNTTFVGGQALPMFGLIEQMKEARTGMSRQGNSLSGEALQNTTATAANQVAEAANQRMDMIARIFANGVKDLYRGVLRLIIAHQDKARTVRLRGKWIEIDPRSWDAEMDVIANVGIGHGTDQERIGALQGVLMYQEKAMANPSLGLVEPSHVYNAISDLVEASHLPGVESYFANPEDKKPEQPQPSPQEQMFKAQMQMDQAKVQMDAEAKKAKIQSDQQIAGQKLQFEGQKFSAEMAQDEDQFDRELDLKREQIAAELVTKSDISNIKMGGRPG